MNAHSIVFDFNLLTLSGQEMLDQVDVLKSQIDGDKLKYLELGNEYYITKKYNWSLPNSTYYMNKALPLIQKIRKEIPNGQIAVVSDRPKNPYNNATAWNDGIAEFKNDFDAVTIHDYSCYSSMHNDKIQGTYICICIFYQNAIFIVGCNYK